MQAQFEIIDAAFSKLPNLEINAELKGAVDAVIAQLDSGTLRVANNIDGHWILNESIKKAILLAFKIWPNLICGTNHFDKIALKNLNWQTEDYSRAQYRAVPGSITRYGAYIGPNVVLLPSFVNIGAYVGANTMVDAWATIGSCAQIGANCHISGGAGIGGVLEPLQALPVIIEDNCFIGARSEIVEGVLVGIGSVISMGVFIGASTKIVERGSGKISYGVIPPYSVVIPGSLACPKTPNLSLQCAVIIKTVDAQTKAKVGINELLRS